MKIKGYVWINEPDGLREVNVEISRKEIEDFMIRKVRDTECGYVELLNVYISVDFN